jgi:hypothetical protein
MDETPRFTSVADRYRPDILKLHESIWRRTTVSILVVVDPQISLTEGPSAFGVARVVRLLRESRVGCKRFKVDLAVRDAGALVINNDPAPSQPRYDNFRFDQFEDGAPILNRYHEVWCFGFRPGNDGSTNDANITAAGSLPASDSELAALTRWMNERKGGLLAMGDHHYLGASMCHRIPRIRSMRRWTNAQGVPPIGTYQRHDTNRPATPAEQSGAAEIDFLNQEDQVPQRIEWTPWVSHHISPFRLRSRPHPILCHPTLGPIDVMPDHPHEGWCYENDEIDLTATFDFAGYAGAEYPQVGDERPAPTVIAYGTTTPSPPYDLEKGPSPKKRFGMISAYDGHRAGVGRVVTDSTWHHWFDENVQAIEAAGGDNWAKISRYYLNVAVWLTPPGVGDICIAFDALQSHFEYLGWQEYTPRSSVFELGARFRTKLSQVYGPCWVTQWVLDRLQLVDDDIWAYLKDRLFWSKGGPGPGGPCLSCPPLEAFEAAVLGGVVRATMPLAAAIKKDVDARSEKLRMLTPEDLVDAALKGAQAGAADFRRALAESVAELKPLLKAGRETKAEARPR